MRGRTAAVEQARAASRNAPVQTDAVRLAATPRARIQSISAGSALASLDARAAGDDQRVEARGAPRRWPLRE